MLICGIYMHIFRFFCFHDLKHFYAWDMIKVLNTISVIYQTPYHIKFFFYCFRFKKIIVLAQEYCCHGEFSVEGNYTINKSQGLVGISQPLSDLGKTHKLS